MKLRGQHYPKGDTVPNLGLASSVQSRSRAGLCNVQARAFPLLAYALTQVLYSCSASPPVQPQRPQVAPPVEQVSRVVITPTRAATLDELFAEAQLSLQQGKPQQAAAQFDRIVQLEPQGAFAPRALLQSGLAYEAFDAWQQSAQRFEQLANGGAEAQLVADALVRSIRVRLHLGDWRQAQANSVALLSQFPESSPIDKIVAHTGWSLGALHAGQLETADYHVAKGLSVVDQLSLDRGGRMPRDLGVLYFALGESRRVKVEAAHLDSNPSHFAQSLEQRCARLLEAQSAYSDTMRAHDAHWSTLAGLRVGELYADLHTELLDIPPPRSVQTKQQHLFEGAMRERYSVLLNKALSMIEHTVAMAERTGVAPRWRQRALDLRVQLQNAVAREQQILDSLPYTRQQLRAALKALGKRAQ